MKTRRKIRKTRVTKKSIRKILDDSKQQKAIGQKSKKIIKPGPWTNIETKININASLHPSNVIIGTVYGTYIREVDWIEQGWYPIYINVTSDNMKEDIEKHGIDNYLASCERSLNHSKRDLGTIILLNIVSESLQSENPFISCRAKTNKKSIKGFSAMRKKEYKIL